MLNKIKSNIYSYRFDDNYYHIQCDLRYRILDFQYASSTFSTLAKGS